MTTTFRVLFVVAVALVVGARFLYENWEAMGKTDAPATNERLRVVDSFDDLSYPASQELGWPFVTKAYTAYILIIVDPSHSMAIEPPEPFVVDPTASMAGLAAEVPEPAESFDLEMLSRPQYIIINWAIGLLVVIGAGYAAWWWTVTRSAWHQIRLSEALSLVAVFTAALGAQRVGWVTWTEIPLWLSLTAFIVLIPMHQRYLWSLRKWPDHGRTATSSGDALSAGIFQADHR